MKLNKEGSTRWVLLIGRIAIKFPCPSTKKSWLQGLVANMVERELAYTKSDTLCPVYFSAWWGLFNIVPRVAVLTDEEYIEHVLKVHPKSPNYVNIILWPCNDFVLHIEGKSNSYGWYKGKVVAIDYGN